MQVPCDVFLIVWFGSITCFACCKISHIVFAFRTKVYYLGIVLDLRRICGCDLWLCLFALSWPCATGRKLKSNPPLSLSSSSVRSNGSHNTWWRRRPPGTVVTTECRHARFESVNHKTHFKSNPDRQTCRCWLKDQQDPRQALPEKKKREIKS